MHVVLTGATGFIGRRVASQLLTRGHRVLALLHKTPWASSDPNLSCVDLGLTNQDTLLHFLSSGGTEFQSGFTFVDLAWNLERNAHYTPYVEHIRRFTLLLEILEPLGLKKVIGIGTSDEYGAQEGVVEEHADVAPLSSPYAWSKRATHTLLEAWGKQRERTVFWLRPFIVYGPEQRGSMLIPYALNAVRTHTIANFSDGQQIRDFIYVDDAAEGIVSAVESSAQGSFTLNLGTGKGVKVRSILEKIAELYGASELFRYGVQSKRMSEPQVRVADTRRAFEVLGWSAQVPWEEGIAKSCGRIG